MIKVINDIHLDARRVGGTTEMSRAALQVYSLQYFEQLLQMCSAADVLMILGDLFDKNKIEEWVWYQTYQLISSFILENPSCKVILVRGNHDSRSTDRQSMCSLELLAGLLGDKITFVFDDIHRFRDEGKSHYVIPHMFDQTQFDAALSVVPDTVDFLYLHANIDNPFANGDHSLNVSKDQIKTLHDKGVTVICGHEHQRRRPFPNVHVIGNQFPTSIADCKGNSEKFMLKIDSMHGITKERTWSAAGTYYDVEVGMLSMLPSDAQFVRVGGEVAKADFAKVIQEVDKYRRRSSAFVVSNAVAVIAENQALRAETVTNINVVDLLIAAVPEKFKERVAACRV